MRRALVIAVLAACRSKSAAPDQKELNSEAQVLLNQVSRSLKAYWNAHGAFPAGTTGPLPAAPCCRSPRGLCPVTTAWRSDAIWAQLGLEVLDPTHFQLAYESDGRAATARALADFDCDGTPITYTLTVTAQGGVPRAVLDQPPVRAD